MNHPINILVASPVDKRNKAKLEAAASGCRLFFSGGNDFSPELFRQAEIIFGNPTLNQLRFAEKLRWIQLYSAGAGPLCGKRSSRQAYA
jgi:hypothetical protein